MYGLQRPPASYVGFGLVAVIILVFLTFRPAFNSIPSAKITHLHSSRPENTDPQTPIINKTVITPELLGVVLDYKRPSISSPNGRYTLNLETTGNVVLKDRETAVWWTNTGDNFTDNSHILTLSQSGELSVSALLKKEWEKIWHSELLPQCAAASKDPTAIHQLTLSDDGMLEIHPRCQLYVAPPQASNGRLALIVSGLYRTNPKTCATHMSQIAAHPAFTNIDIFVYALYEPKDITGGMSPSGIEANIRECYGANLREVVLELVSQVEEPFPGDILSPCGGKLHRLHSQLKTLYNSGMLWWQWSLEAGISHQTVLRIRTDTIFGTHKLPLFRSVAELGHGKVVIPHTSPVPPTSPPDYFYCRVPSGGLEVGPSDQLAYGPPAAMHIWLSFYRYFPTIIKHADAGDHNSGGFIGCEVLPDGSDPKECKDPAPCSIECIVAYYLRSMGLDFVADFTWDQHLQR